MHLKDGFLLLPQPNDFSLSALAFTSCLETSLAAAISDKPRVSALRGHTQPEEVAGH